MEIHRLNISAESPPRPGSERSFGFVFTVVFLVIGLAPLATGGLVRPLALAAAAALLLVALIAPAWLSRPNKVWFYFAMILHRVMGPLTLGMIYAVCIVPVGVLGRLTGRDPLRLRRKADVVSYWLPHENADHGSMRDQF